MGRTILLAGVANLLIIVGLATRNGEWIALAIPLFVYLLAGIASSPLSLAFESKRSLSSDRAPQGTPVQVVVTLRNTGDTIAECRIVDQVPEGLNVIKGETEYFGTFTRYQTINLKYVVTAGRGNFHFNGVRLSATDRFGVLKRQRFIPSPGRIFLVPSAAGLPGLRLRPQRTLAYAGPIPARIGGPDLEFFGIREYEPGDPLRWIHWKGNARYPGRMFSKEFELERIVDVGIILDARATSNIEINGDALFEYAVHAAATLAETVLSAGNRAGLLIYGKVLDWTFPGYGKLQRERIFQALARADLGESMVFDRLDNLPTRYFPPKSQIIVISPLQHGDVEQLLRMRSHGYGMFVLSPDPIAFEWQSIHDQPGAEDARRIAGLERNMARSKLQSAGIEVLEWKVDAPLEHVFSGRQAAGNNRMSWRVG